MLGGLALVATACPDPNVPSGPTTTTTTTTSALPPTAVMQANPASGTTPFAVSFTSVGSLANSGTIVSYDWNFGDGGLGSGASTTHVYNTPGVYNATLTVTNSNGLGATSAATSITAIAPVVPRFYVKSSGGDTPTCGPISEPCASINHGQARAVAATVPMVIVAGGTYGPTTVQSGLEIQGGYCRRQRLLFNRCTDKTHFAGGEYIPIREWRF